MSERKKSMIWPGGIRLKLNEEEFNKLWGILDSHPEDTDKDLKDVEHFKRRLSEAAKRHDAYYDRKLEKRRELKEEHPEWFEEREEEK